MSLISYERPPQPSRAASLFPAYPCNRNGARPLVFLDHGTPKTLCLSQVKAVATTVASSQRRLSRSSSVGSEGTCQRLFSAIAKSFILNWCFFWLGEDLKEKGVSVSLRHPTLSPPVASHTLHHHPTFCAHTPTPLSADCEFHVRDPEERNGALARLAPPKSARTWDNDRRWSKSVVARSMTGENPG